MMASISGRDTLPEMRVRRALHRAGFRFRLHARTLPGRPDLVLCKHRAVIVVHGCFWHRHDGCRTASKPSANAGFWQAKFSALDQIKDLNTLQLTDLGRAWWEEYGDDGYWFFDLREGSCQRALQDEYHISRGIKLGPDPY